MRAVLTLGGGFVLLIAGAILLIPLIPLPEVGLPVLVVGLRLLGRHYSWAQTANEKLDRIVRAGRRQWTRLPPPVRIAILLLLAAAGALLIHVLAT